MIIDKYTTEAEKGKEENKDKIVISTEQFALIEAIRELTNAIKFSARNR
jgi:hypothetical protein